MSRAGGLRLGFARGVAPSKWAERWIAAGRPPLELVPLPLSGPRPEDLDVVLERVDPGARPAGSEGGGRTRHALRLYEEAVALVLPADHELASQPSVDLDDLALVTLLSHPEHRPGWPAAEPWADPSWVPADAEAALKLVASGLGGALMPLPLARHLAGRRAHAVLPVAEGGGDGNGTDPPLQGTEIWASWAVERDAEDVQHLAGVLRGRTARSSR